MSRTLDRKKPFATVHGDGDHKHAFEQDGRLFDALGHEIAASGDSGAQPPAPAPAPASAPPTGDGASNLPPQSSATGATVMVTAAAALLGMGAEALIEELPDQSDDMLGVLKSMEPLGKNRKTVLAAIDALVESRANPQAEPPAPPPPAGDQVNQQLNAS